MVAKKMKEEIFVTIYRPATHFLASSGFLEGLLLAMWKWLAKAISMQLQYGFLHNEYCKGAMMSKYYFLVTATSRSTHPVSTVSFIGN